MNYTINGLPNYGPFTNIHMGDIITCEVKNKNIYCKVINETNTAYNVIELDTTITNKCVIFTEERDIKIL